jgi:hypothetical protein
VSDDDLDREYEALRAEHAELEHEHGRLRELPRDIDAHRAHAARLRAHLARLHAYVAARHAAVPDKV